MGPSKSKFAGFSIELLAVLSTIDGQMSTIGLTVFQFLQAEKFAQHALEPQKEEGLEIYRIRAIHLNGHTLKTIH